MVSQGLWEIEALLVSLVQQEHLDLLGQQVQQDLPDQLEPEVHLGRLVLRV